MRQLGPNSYQLIAGERRLQAAKRAHLTSVPVYIRIADDQQMLEMAIIENIQRENLNPIEVALSYQRLLTECAIKQEELGTRVGKNRTTVNNYLRLLKLPPDIQIALRDQRISMGHARALINVASVTVQLKILKEILDKDLSVRSVEALVRTAAQSRPAAATQRPSEQLQQAAQQASTQLTSHLGTPVKVQLSSKERGEIKIAFSSAQDLTRILTMLDQDS